MTNTPILPKPFQFTLPAGNLISPDVIMGRDGFVSFAVAPTGGNITDMAIDVKFHPSDIYNQFLEGSDFSSSSISEVIRAFSTPPNTVASGGTSWVQLNLGFIFSFRIRFVVSAPTAIVINGVK